MKGILKQVLTITEKITLKLLQGFTMFQGFWDYLRIFIKNQSFGQFLVSLVVFLGDKELIFLLLFVTMISQAYN